MKLINNENEVWRGIRTVPGALTMNYDFRSIVSSKRTAKTIKTARRGSFQYWRRDWNISINFWMRSGWEVGESGARRQRVKWSFRQNSINTHLRKLKFTECSSPSEHESTLIRQPSESSLLNLLICWMLELSSVCSWGWKVAAKSSFSYNENSSETVLNF